MPAVSSMHAMYICKYMAAHETLGRNTLRGIPWCIVAMNGSYAATRPLSPLLGLTSASEVRM